MKECNTCGIKFHLYVQKIDLSFLAPADVVAIFANLLDNAIESSVSSTTKRIFLSIYSMNDAFLVIHVENSADVEPTSINGQLLTNKLDKSKHGLGMLSIQKALENYHGKLNWNYEENSHIFNTDILISFNQKGVKTH